MRRCSGPGRGVYPALQPVLDAAERLDRVHDLGRCLRRLAIEPIGGLPRDVSLFVNLHPRDLFDDELLGGSSALASVADRITLEITERSALNRQHEVRRRLVALREMGFRIALDDFGAGFGGLTSFTLLEPEVVKLDMALIRDIEREPTKQALVRTVVAMCRDMGIVAIAEGVETGAERDELARAGCDVMQGYLFSRPGEAFCDPVF